MLLATSENRLGASSVRSCLLFERAVRGTLVRREELAFDTRFAAAASGKPEPVGHLFLMLDGHYVSDRGEHLAGPFGLMLADDEWERRGNHSRTFRTDGPRVDVVQLRIAKEHLRAPIGLDAGPLRVPSACFDATRALLDAPDATALARLVDELARAGIVASSVTSTVIDEEPERFRRLWSALEPLYREYGATASLKQLASSLDMSMRQVGRDAKELSAAFGIGGGYRDALLVLRLRMAVLMLAAKGAAVADVAKLVGYGSPIAMARAFRDAKLPSPSVIQGELAAE
ncbi:MAG: helix-turn-helix transcriptional regulator [Kofleriaceae bacterium]|nr:helix-turn-helix transcriptional regulator [Kofleriaceae bacterium]